MKKYMSYIIVVLLAFTSIFAFWKQVHINQLEQTIDTAHFRIAEQLSYGSLFHLYDQVIENPTEENRQALYSALDNKESQFFSYIRLALTQEQFDKLFSRSKYNKKPLIHYQLSGSQLYNVKEMEQNHIEHIKRMKKAWTDFEERVERSSLGYEDPVYLAKEYMKLSKLLQKIYTSMADVQ